MTKELICIEASNTIAFGDYSLATKTKAEDFEFQGDLYKVKTFSEITKLEKNGLFVYESVPGTAVQSFMMSDIGVSFEVLGDKDAQITVELEPKQEYTVNVGGNEVGSMVTNLSGKLSANVELGTGEYVSVIIEKK
ncbi:MAG: endosialidase [Eubacteriales bacterium]